MKNTFGSDLSLTIFGESHGRAVGAVLDGMAAGVPVEDAFLAACMDKRRARGDGLSTPRVEGDAVQFLSGVVNGRTTGTAIALMIENQNTRSGDSIALLAIARTLETIASWENGERMDNWDNVILWEEGMEGYTPEKKGRVKYARFFMLSLIHI